MAKTVLLLGAGASKASDYELPTMDEFFGELFKDTARTESNGSDKYRRLRVFLAEQYGRRKRANLEEVVSYLHENQESTLPIGIERRTFLTRAREELDQYILERLVTNTPGKKKPEFESAASFDWKFDCDLHSQVFSQLDADSDSILNMNYDMIADGTLAKMTAWKSVAQNTTEALRAVASPAVHPDHPATKRVSYIKLHGSLDSVTCLNQSCSGYHFIRKRPKAGHWQGGTKGAMCGLCGAPVALGIIPPVLSKSTREWSIGFDWSLAFHSLADSARWILWGVSLAPSDHALRALLGESAQERQNRLPADGMPMSPIDLIVINPCQHAKDRAEDVAQAAAIPYDSAQEFLANCPKRGV
jgi:hypothetical protein